MATFLRRQQKGVFGDEQWTARQRWKVDNASAEGFAAGRLGAELATATTSRLYDPICTAVDVQLSYFAGQKALLTEQFTAVRKPNTATVAGSTSSRWRLATLDRDYNVMSGPVGDGQCVPPPIRGQQPSSGRQRIHQGQGVLLFAGRGNLALVAALRHVHEHGEPRRGRGIAAADGLSLLARVRGRRDPLVLRLHFCREPVALV
jgi:hypothetical protein